MLTAPRSRSAADIGLGGTLPGGVTAASGVCRYGCRCRPWRAVSRRPPSGAARAAARRAYTRRVAHTACTRHTPATAQRHDPISTSSSWLTPAILSFDAGLYVADVEL